jgi:hypothetical protein
MVAMNKRGIVYTILVVFFVSLLFSYASFFLLSQKNTLIPATSYAFVVGSALKQLQNMSWDYSLGASSTLITLSSFATNSSLCYNSSLLTSVQESLIRFGSQFSPTLALNCSVLIRPFGAILEQNYSGTRLKISNITADISLTGTLPAGEWSTSSNPVADAVFNPLISISFSNGSNSFGFSVRQNGSQINEVYTLTHALGTISVSYGLNKTLVVSVSSESLAQQFTLQNIQFIFDTYSGYPLPAIEPYFYSASVLSFNYSRISYSGPVRLI